MIKLGFLGGGSDSIAGKTHFIAAQMDAKFTLVGGIFSHDEEKSRQAAAEFGVKSFSQLDDLIGQIDMLVVLLPTPMHFQTLMDLHQYKIPIICEKPLVSSVEQMAAIEQAYRGRFLAVTNNYSGYPMLRELKALIGQNHLGKIKNIIVDMPQESFFRPPKSIKYPQKWRLKDDYIPMIALDLGVHVHHLSTFLLQQEPKAVFGEFNSLSKYDVVDDVKINLRYENSIGSLAFSKTKLGNANALRVEVYGDQGGASWSHNNNEVLEICGNNGHKTILNRGCDLLVANQKRYSRMTVGHPGGFIEAFANLYTDIYDCYLGYQQSGVMANPYVFGLEQAKAGLTLLHKAKDSYLKGAWCEP